jgi:dihydroneopterin aldolase
MYAGEKRINSFVKNKSTMALIELEEMEFYAYHGHFEEEQVVGNKFLVNISIETDCSKAAESDKFQDALDYVSIYKITKQEMDKKSHLLEHLVGRIIDRIHNEFPQIVHSKVKVSKLNPPMGGKMEKVSVTFSR